MYRSILSPNIKSLVRVLEGVYARRPCGGDGSLGILQRTTFTTIGYYSCYWDGE